MFLRGAIKKKNLPNFGHCPNKGGGGVSGAAKLFFKKGYGHVIGGRVGGSRPKKFLTKMFLDL